MIFLVALGWWYKNIEVASDAKELASVVEDARWVLDEIWKGVKEGPVVDMLIRRGGESKRGRAEEDAAVKGRKTKRKSVLFQPFSPIKQC